MVWCCATVLALAMGVARADVEIPTVAIPGTDVRIAVYETTVAEFREFVEATGYDATAGMMSLRADAVDWAPNGDSWSSPGFTQGDRHPVVGVSLADARAYSAWLTAEAGKTDPRFGSTLVYRLPSDYEWSLAAGLDEDPAATPEARMYGAPSTYPWGSGWPPPKGFGNYAGSESAPGKPSWWGTIPGGYRDAYARTAPVGSFAANALGIHDLSGNVWEWVDTPYTADSIAYPLRGGCWGSDRPAYLLSARRNPAHPDLRNDETGFRIVIATVAEGAAPRIGFQSPRNSGGRFSRNAAMPSRWSALLVASRN